MILLSVAERVSRMIEPTQVRLPEACCYPCAPFAPCPWDPD